METREAPPPGPERDAEIARWATNGAIWHIVEMDTGHYRCTPNLDGTIPYVMQIQTRCGVTLAAEREAPIGKTPIGRICGRCLQRGEGRMQRLSTSAAALMALRGER